MSRKSKITNSDFATFVVKMTFQFYFEAYVVCLIFRFRATTRQFELKCTDLMIKAIAPTFYLEVQPKIEYLRWARPFDCEKNSFANETFQCFVVSDSAICLALMLVYLRPFKYFYHISNKILTVISLAFLTMSCCVWRLRHSTMSLPSSEEHWSRLASSAAES